MARTGTELCFGVEDVRLSLKREFWDRSWGRIVVNPCPTVVVKRGVAVAFLDDHRC